MVLYPFGLFRSLGSGRALGRGLPRDRTAHHYDLRLGVHSRRTLRRPLRARSLRRGPPPACREVRHDPEDAPRPLRSGPHRHPRTSRRRTRAPARARRSRGVQALAGGAGRYVPRALRRRPHPIKLTATERVEYAEADAVYRDFLQKHHLVVRTPEDWQRFILVASTSHSGGREALLAARKRREIRASAERKGATLESLLKGHWQDRTIVFTKSVEEVYALSTRFLVPGITYETPARERKEILDRFREGRYRAIIASDVLNEGVDVPEANVAVILAGSASHREYVQRLGRVLRPREGKRATLYELVTSDTGEEAASRRRRGSLQQSFQEAAT